MVIPFPDHLFGSFMQLKPWITSLHLEDIYPHIPDISASVVDVTLLAVAGSLVEILLLAGVAGSVDKTSFVFREVSAHGIKSGKERMS